MARAAATLRCYCFASGHMEFGARVPKGAIPIAVGPATALRDWMEPLARRAYDGKTLLVPGIPEAPNQHAALDALHRFTAWIRTHNLPEGCYVLGA